MLSTKKWRFVAIKFSSNVQINNSEFARFTSFFIKCCLLNGKGLGDSDAIVPTRCRWGSGRNKAPFRLDGHLRLPLCHGGFDFYCASPQTSSAADGIEPTSFPSESKLWHIRVELEVRAKIIIHDSITSKSNTWWNSFEWGITTQPLNESSHDAKAK